MSRTFVLAGLLVAAFAAAAGAEEELLRLTPSQADLKARSDDWYGVYMNGKKIGWFRDTFGHAGAGADAAYVKSSSCLFAIEARGQTVEVQISEREEFDGAAPWALRGARCETKQAERTETIEMLRGADGWSASVSDGGEPRAMTVAPFDYTLADAMTATLWARAGRAVGDTARVRSYSVSKLLPDVSTMTVAAVKESLVSGVVKKFYEMTVKSARRGTEASATVDAEGRPIAGSFGGLFEIRAEPEEQARRTEKSGDLFVYGVARIDRPIGHPKRVTKLVIDVEGEGLDKIPACPRQSVTRAADGKTVTLSIGADAGNTETASAAETADALAETVEYPVKLPKVVALATQAVGDAKTPQEKVERLVHFVAKYVEDADVVRHMPVTELIESKRGDCTEHALLFVVLARAASIPAREVSGLMYMGDGVKAFGPHQWNEVVLDGRWVAVDPAWDETTVDAARVTLERGDKGMGGIATMGRLKFRLKDVATLK